VWNRQADRFSDVLHPNRANVAKDEIRTLLAETYKCGKDIISVFGFRTQYGGGKSTGFGLIYESVEALKKFEPHYRLVRIGVANKIEKASRQQRTLEPVCLKKLWHYGANWMFRQATQEPSQDVTRNGQGQGCSEEEGEVEDCLAGG